MTSESIPDRRAFLGLTSAGIAGLFLSQADQATGAAKDQPAGEKKPTRFLIACMTLPYAQFPLERALAGIKTAGYRHVAWGHTHLEADGKRRPILADDAPVEQAREVAKKCRDFGLEPVMMFGPSPDAVVPLKQCIRQAAAAGIAQLLTFGHAKGDDSKLWVRNLRELGPVARDHGVLVVVKQHGGNTGTGAACAEIVREVNDEGIKVCYDAGNVMDYNKTDPLPDIRTCASEVRSFCIKDHRLSPKDQDCGPGFGEIDHYKLLGPVAFTGRVLPLCCENIFAPLLPRPATPEGTDALARRAREFLETVIQGLQV